MLLGAIAYGLQAVLFYSALGYGTVASVSLLFYTYPVLVLVASLVLGLRSWSWLAGGSAARPLPALPSSSRPVVRSPSSRSAWRWPSAPPAVSPSSSWPTAALIPRTPAIVAATWVSFGVALSTLLLAFMLGELETLSGRAWLVLLVSGAMTGLGTAGMYVVLAALGPAPASVLLSLQTVVAILGSALLLGQPVLAGQVIGGAAILGAIALMAFGTRREAHAGTRPRAAAATLRE